MPYVSISFGVALIGVGVWGYTKSDLEGPAKYTALIPAAFGAVLVVCGAVGLVARLLKHAMHAAAAVGLIGLLLGAGRFIWGAVKSGIDFDKIGTQAIVAMMALCLVFVGLCVNSFIAARRRRAAREASGTQR